MSRKVGIGIGVGKSPLSLQGGLLNYLQRLQSIYSSDLVSHFSIDETAGTSLTDSINGYNAPIVNVTLNQTGKKKKAGLWGVGSYGNIYTAMTHADKDEGTIMFFAKTEQSKWNDATSYTIFNVMWTGVADIITVNNSVSALVASYKRNNVEKKYTTGSPNTSDWIHIAFSWSKTNDRINCFINGVKLNDLATITDIGNHSGAALGTSYCGIGSQRGNTSTVPWSGLIDEFTILKRETSESELQSLLGYHQVIFEGDSRTNLKPWTVGSIKNLDYSPRNVAVSGATVADIQGRGVTSVDNKYRAGKNNILFLWCGVNSNSLTAQQLYDGIRTYCLSRKAAGYKIVIATEIDAQGTLVGWHEKYTALNTLIRNNDFADAVADFGAITELQDATNTTYFDVDQIHPVLAGYTLLIDVAYAAILSVI